MVRFGEYLDQRTRDEWDTKYLDYKYVPVFRCPPLPNSYAICRKVAKIHHPAYH